MDQTKYYVDLIIISYVPWVINIINVIIVFACGLDTVYSSNFLCTVHVPCKLMRHSNNKYMATVSRFSYPYWWESIQTQLI